MRIFFELGDALLARLAAMADGERQHGSRLMASRLLCTVPVRPRCQSQARCHDSANIFCAASSPDRPLELKPRNLACVRAWYTVVPSSRSKFSVGASLGRQGRREHHARHKPEAANLEPAPTQTIQRAAPALASRQQPWHRRPALHYPDGVPALPQQGAGARDCAFGRAQSASPAMAAKATRTPGAAQRCRRRRRVVVHKRGDWG